MTTVTCPDCGRAAVVLGRFDRASAGGPVEYLRIRCAALSLIVAAAEVQATATKPEDRVRGTGN